MDTWARFPSSIAFTWVIKRPIWSIFKLHSFHCYSWADPRTSNFLIFLLRLQASNRQVDTWVKFASSIASIGAIKRLICRVSKVTSLHIYTWADCWTCDYLICLLRLQECDHQADAWVGCCSSRAFIWDFERAICTISRPSSFDLSFTSITSNCSLVYHSFNIQKHKLKIIQAYEYDIILAWLSNFDTILWRETCLTTLFSWSNLVTW